MPELPEVETLRQQLENKIFGSKILKNESFDEKIASLRNIRGKRVVGVRRQGKTLIIELDNDRDIQIHLRMTGRLLWQTVSTVPRYTRWKISFDGGDIFLVDPRRFATVKMSRKTENRADREILGSFDLKKFVKLNGGRSTRIKSLIMDQNVINGIGNIYACEILHAAGIHPERKAATLAYNDWQRILHQAKTILKKAIKNRGTSISDWRDLYGNKGENQNELKVYGQKGHNCCFCGGIVHRTKQSGRSTYFCPICQK